MKSDKRKPTIVEEQLCVEMKLHPRLITKQRLRDEIQHWADTLKVKPTQIRIQDMKNKWASCSTKGWVSFSKSLLKETRAFRNYAIVHELLHLSIPNHGKLFKTMMNIHLPGWENTLADGVNS